MPPFGGRASALARFGDGARRDVAWRARRRERAPARGARAARGRAGREGEGARAARAGASLGARAARAGAMTRAASADALSWTGGGALQSSMLGAAIVDFGIQLVGWAAASALRTEKFYDILGSVAFATTAALTLGTSAMMPRQKLASALAMAWTARLGIFLGARAHRDGGDSRFDGVKDKPGVFAVYWFLQGVWVWVTSLPVYLLNGSPGQSPDLNAVDWTLAAFWAFGFVFEVVADVQKFVFKSDKSNKGKYIKHGLWSLSRHPNYFGEICMWFGVAGIACNGLATSNPGRAAGAFASPLFVTYLLTKMSGIPILERMADERWGKDEGYQSYKRTTPVLVPKLPGM